MKTINKEVLKEAAKLLMFEMEEKQYDTLLKEFEITLQQMELIKKIKGVDEVEPLVYPYDIEVNTLREDVPSDTLTAEDALKNAGSKLGGQVKLPKVI